MSNDLFTTKLAQVVAGVVNNMDALIELIFIDPTTQIYNRAAFNHTSFCKIAIIDVDSLKYLNDNYSHELGDRALSITSSMLVERFGFSRVFRLSGDEFAVICYDESQYETFRASMCDAQDEAMKLVGFTYGIADCLTEADQQLKQSKQLREKQGVRQGRNQSVKPLWYDALVAYHTYRTRIE